MKSTVKILFLFNVIFVLTGCWNNRDLTDLAIVTGIAFDKAEGGKIEITAQIVKPEAIRSSGESGGNSKKSYENVKSTGATVFEASRDLISKINKRAYYGQVQLIVISEALAKDGISDFLDLFERDTETRRRAYLLIAEGMNASTVLESESRMTGLPSTHELGALDASKAFGKTPKVALIDMLKEFGMEGNSVVLPKIYKNKKTGPVYQEDLIMEGTAVIKKGKLVGFLDSIQTRGFLFADGKVKSTIINVSSPINSEKQAEKSYKSFRTFFTFHRHHIDRCGAQKYNGFRQ